MVKTDSTMIQVEVAYALEQAQLLLSIHVAQGTTVLEAIKQSGILHHFPDIDLSRHQVGVYSRICSLDTVVNHGDRIEIYRPLQVDPKEARRIKAKSKLS